jgi:hypothetical protein
VEDDHQPTLEFNQDGSLRAAELTIVNLRPGIDGAASSGLWEQVSFVNSSALPQTGREITITFIMLQAELLFS